MAEEVKKIITVEVGKSITSVRDFKKHIEDLRGALLGLNEESEEYKTISEQIATDQAKLNDVMAVGKKNTDAAAGSYVELNNQLKALRQQYKALSETERNSTTGQAILTNISKLDTQLKDIDASMGQYQRNVGNYKQAFDGAFQTIANEVSKTNPLIGTLISTVQKLIPAFQGVSKSAAAAGTSIKGAISSTGIGIFIVALGEVVAHWEEISNWASRVLGIQKNITSETRSAAEQAKILADKYKEARDYAHEIAVAQGKTPLEIANEDVEEIENDAQRLRDAEKMIETYLQKYHDAFISNRAAVLEESRQRGKWFQKGGFISEETQEKVKDIYDHMIQDLQGYTNNYGELVQLHNNLTTGSAGALQETLKNFSRWLKEQNKINNKLYEDDQEQLAKALRNQGIERTKYLTGLKKSAHDAELVLKSEVEQENQLYEEQKQFIIDNIQNQAAQNEALENLERAHQAKLEQIRKKGSSGSSNATADQKKKDLERLAEIKESLKDELQALDDKYVEELTLMEKYGEDTTELTKKWCEAREKIVLDQYQKDLDNQKKQQDKLLQAQKDALNESLYQQGKGQDWRTIAAESKNTSGKDYWWDIFNLFPGEGRPDIQKEREQVDLIYQIEQQGYMDRIDLYNDFLSQLEEGSQEYLETEKAINQEKMDLATLEYEHDKELQRRVAEDAENRQKIISTIANNTSSIWSSITDAMLVNEEQGSNKWKAYKTSEAVVNTIAGALSAFMSGVNSGVPAPWNLALAATMAASTAAAGYAEVRKIQATKMGSTNSASGSPSANASVGVEPLLNQDYDLQRITNLSLQSDAYLPGKTQVYVLESDIQEVGNRVQVRENNATF